MKTGAAGRQDARATRTDRTFVARSRPRRGGRPTPARRTRARERETSAGQRAAPHDLARRSDPASSDTGIGSLFIVNNKTESLCALKHWGPTVPHQAVCDKVFASHRASVKANLYSDVITTEGKQYCFHITRGEITYIATTETETEPLMVIEFLTQLHIVLKAYFGDVTESVLQVRSPPLSRAASSPAPISPSPSCSATFQTRDTHLSRLFLRLSVSQEHHVTLYQLLDEMVDCGIPVNTHPGGLKVLVPPPNLINRAQSMVFGHQGVPASDQDPLKLLPLPWRSNNIKYASNEIYLDVIESIDATLDSEGRVLNSAIHGTIEVNSRLSGMPDVSLSLSNSHLIEEYSFHPSVRLSRFAADRVVSFVPADGQFTLMSYKVRPPQTKETNQWQPKYIRQNPWHQSQISGAGQNSPQVPLPLYIRPQATFGATQGRVSIVCGTKPAFEKPVENVSLEIRLPRALRAPTPRRRTAPPRTTTPAGSCAGSSTSSPTIRRRV